MQKQRIPKRSVGDDGQGFTRIDVLNLQLVLVIRSNTDGECLYECIERQVMPYRQETTNEMSHDEFHERLPQKQGAHSCEFAKCAKYRVEFTTPSRRAHTQICNTFRIHMGIYDPNVRER